MTTPQLAVISADATSGIDISTARNVPTLVEAMISVLNALQGGVVIRTEQAQ